MRLKEGVNLVAFIRKVKECKGDVFLQTKEGDHLNRMWVHSPPLGAQGNFNRKEKHDTMKRKRRSVD